MPTFTNIAAYQFAQLTELKSLRVRLVDLCRLGQLKGTILLSQEGINLFVAGMAAEIEKLLAELRAIPGLESLKAKYSESENQPFNRMLVRIKKEIIAFGVEGIHPEQRTSPKLAPQELKQWLDEGRPITLLDTRNDYEVKLGTFKGAKVLDINHFRKFPEAVAQLPEEMKEAPIVMFCTGGIRCEKAGPFMEREGFKNIHQLDGGILKYFEDCGGAHYDGECFVFDRRVGVDPALHETTAVQCFACLAPLTEEDQEDPRFNPPTSCPFCYKDEEQVAEERLRTSQERINQVTTPLPGSVPSVQNKPVRVPPQFDKAPLLDFLNGALGHISKERWEEQFAAGRILDANLQPVSPTRPARVGERIYVTQPQTTEPDVEADVQVIYEDQALIIVNKPAPLPVHPCGRFNRNTLVHFIHAAYEPLRPRAAHRLDANTTGLMVFTRTYRFASRVQPQFDKGLVEKTYLAKVHGHPNWETFLCEAPISKGPEGDVGIRQVDPEDGLAASTEFTVLSRNPDDTTLLQVKPLTGRTNQIRVHLWDLGFPIVGDPLYLQDRKIGTSQTLALGDAPLCLHAWKIGLTHPISNQWVSFEAKLPDWAR